LGAAARWASRWASAAARFRKLFSVADNDRRAKPGPDQATLRPSARHVQAGWSIRADRRLESLRNLLQAPAEVGPADQRHGGRPGCRREQGQRQEDEALLRIGARRHRQSDHREGDEHDGSQEA